MDSPRLQGHAIRYAVWGSLLWLVVDFGTAGGFRIAYYEKYAPTICLFYIAFPSVFSYLAIGRNWNWKKLLAATLVEIALVEGLFVGNPLVVTFPALLVGIPLALCVYTPLTYFPLWIVRKEMGQHKRVVISLTVVVVVISLMSTFGSQRAW